MSEAGGTILIKASEDVLTLLSSDNENVSWANLAVLAEHSGIESLAESNQMLKYHVDKDFPHEGMKQDSEFLQIDIFGEEWVYVMQSLIKQGENIEVYGSINHEHGTTEYYVLNRNSERFCKEFDSEFDDGDESELVKEWLEFVPDELQKKYKRVFSE